MAQVLEAGKNIVITSSLYQLNIAGTTEIPHKYRNYGSILSSLHLKIQEQTYNVGITQVMRLGKNLVISYTAYNV